MEFKLVFQAPPADLMKPMQANESKATPDTVEASEAYVKLTRGYPEQRPADTF